MSRVLIVGANRGIGLALCQQLHARGDEVIATCRRSSEVLDALLGVHVHTEVEVTDQDSLAQLAEKLDAPVDWLMVVAGILEPVTLGEFDAESVRRQFEVNALGPLQTVVALRSRLADGAKIGLVTSRMGSIADNGSGCSYGYRMSKAALNMAGRSLSLDLKPAGVAVQLLHPGWVKTEMTGHTGHLDVDASAKGLIERMDELDMGQTGRFVHVNGEALPW